MNTNLALRIARQFAQALDNEDYVAAQQLLSPQCSYDMRGSVLTEPSSIIESYRASGEWAARELDSIEYENTVERSANGEAVITFIDRIQHQGKELVHRCHQIMRLDNTGLISHIQHKDLPGELEALQTFLRQVGLRSQQ